MRGSGRRKRPTERYKDLIAAGGTGLSVAFDLPTLMGRDPDHPLSLGEVGKCGVNITSLADMERLFDGISLGDITTSMTINSPAPMIFAMYLVVAEKQGADWQRISGTIQNDILKEFIAQKEYIFPPRPSMRLITDIFAFCSEQVPEVEHDLGQRVSHPRGGLDRAAGAGVHAARRPRVRAVRHRRAASTSTTSCPGSRSSSTRTATSSRRSPSTAPRASSGPRRCAIASARRTRARGSCASTRQTAGVSLTAQQPYNNVVRTALQALAAVLGGTNSLHTNSLDEALALPTEEAATIALRTQQIIAHESGVTNIVDPLGGSYFVEKLTRDMEEGTLQYWDTIDRMGGMVEAIELGYPAEGDRRGLVPVPAGGRTPREGHRRRQRLRPGRRRPDRDSLHRRHRGRAAAGAAGRAEEDARQRRRCSARSRRCATTARGKGNTMPAILDCVRAYATVGEMCDALRDVWGEYEEVPVFSDVT